MQQLGSGKKRIIILAKQFLFEVLKSVLWDSGTSLLVIKIWFRNRHKLRNLFPYGQTDHRGNFWRSAVLKVILKQQRVLQISYNEKSCRKELLVRFWPSNPLLVISKIFCRYPLGNGVSFARCCPKSQTGCLKSFVGSKFFISQNN